MNAGETVTVFQDPITCRTSEGVATLIKPIGTNNDGTEQWFVRFDDDDAYAAYHQRTVCQFSPLICELGRIADALANDEIVVIRPGNARAVRIEAALGARG